MPNTAVFFASLKSYFPVLVYYTVKSGSKQQPFGGLWWHTHGKVRQYVPPTCWFSHIMYLVQHQITINIEIEKTARNLTLV